MSCSGSFVGRGATRTDAACRERGVIRYALATYIRYGIDPMSVTDTSFSLRHVPGSVCFMHMMEKAVASQWGLCYERMKQRGVHIQVGPL